MFEVWQVWRENGRFEVYSKTFMEQNPSWGLFESLAKTAALVFQGSPAQVRAWWFEHFKTFGRGWVD